MINLLDINPETYEFQIINEEVLWRYLNARYCTDCPNLKLEPDIGLVDCGCNFFDPQCYHHYEALAAWFSLIRIDRRCVADLEGRYE